MRPLLLLVLQAASLVAQAPAVAAWNQPVEPFRIIGNIYYVGASDVTSYLITTPEGHILLDSGFAETVPQIRANVARLGFKLEDIKVLLNSQAHYDHAAGLAELKSLTRARLLASAQDGALLARGGRGDFAYGDRYPYTPVFRDAVVRDGDEVRLGNTVLTAHLTPGHTKGCTTWTTTVQEQGQTYRVVFVCGLSTPGYRLVDNADYPGIVKDFEATFRKLRALDCDVFLGAHGGYYGLAAKSEARRRGARPNPFIDPAGYRRFLDASEAAFKKELERQREETRP
ncbi:MAG: subclass B3 metallo-beta-lactamase [Bryobacteraceae bacterium]|jgi:metallo-beta-lactamase class B